RHGTGRVRQIGTGRADVAPFSGGRLPRLFRAARIGRARPPDSQPAHAQGFSVPFRPENRRGRGAPGKSKVLGTDRSGQRPIIGNLTLLIPWLGLGEPAPFY